MFTWTQFTSYERREDAQHNVEQASQEIRVDIIFNPLIIVYGLELQGMVMQLVFKIPATSKLQVIVIILRNVVVPFGNPFGFGSWKWKLRFPYWLLAFIILFHAVIPL